VTIAPSQRHWSIFKELLMPLGTAANLTSDAHLAALAIEHGARLYSTDNDFSRFQSLRWTNPIE
jgi:predicted nucleic acid-binding protein